MQRVSKWLRFWFFIGIHPTPAMEKKEQTAKARKKLHKPGTTVICTLWLIASVGWLITLSACASGTEQQTPSTTMTGTTVNDNR